MDYISDKFDLGITNVGSDGSGTALVGMMLVRKAGVPSWNVYDGKALADQFYSGAPSQEYTDPEEEILLSQGPDWRAGFGKTYFDAADPKRYHSSTGADLRFPLGAIAGPITGTCAKVSQLTPVFPDLGFENWASSTDLTYYTEAGTITRSAGTVYAGTYAASLAGTGALLTLPVNRFTNEFRGGQFTYQCRVLYPSSSGRARIGLTDLASTTWSAYNSASASWEQLSVTRTIAATAVAMQLLCQHNSAGTVSFFDGGAISGSVNLSATALGRPTAMAEYNGNLYINFGNTLAKLDGSGSSFVAVYCADANVTDIEPFTDDRLYLACGTSAAYDYLDTYEVVTASTATVNKVWFFKTVHSNNPTMWEADGTTGTTDKSTLRSNLDPAGSAWSGTTKVGSSYHNITSLIQKSGALYIGKEDMPYYLNSAGAVQNDLAPELQTAASATSCKNMKLWKNNLYIPAGAQALLRTDGTTNEFIHPGNYITDLSDFAGQVMAVAYDEEYLFIAVDNGSSVEILAGRDETVDGKTEWRWHPIRELTLAGVEFMFVSTVVKKRLWICSTSASDSIYYIDLPTTYGNVLGDTNRNFQTTAFFTTPFLHGGFKNDKKAFIKLKATLGHAYSASTYWSAAYKKLADTAWTTIGDFDGTATDRTETIYIPAATGSVNPVSTMMQLKWTATTPSSTTTPVLVQYTLSAVMYPPIKTIYHAEILCAKDIQTRIGSVEKNADSTIIATLDNARNASWPVSIRDINGSTRTVKFLPLPKGLPRYTVKRDEKGREMERVYNAFMLEVPLQ